MVNQCDNPEDRRDKIIAIPVNQAEHDLIKRISKTEGFSMAAICRNSAITYAYDHGYAIDETLTARQAGNARHD